MSGLFGTAASLTSDLNLLLQLVILVILLAGYKFGKVKKADSLKTHGRIMYAAVLLNAVSILLAMGPAFFTYFGAVLGEVLIIGFPLSLVHHLLGIMAEALGIVFVFRKFGNVRMWMRLTMVTWLIAFALGMVFYIRYYTM